MSKKGSGMMNFLFWGTYLIAMLAAWYHTFEVFRQSDPIFIAALAATAIDGALALTIYLGGRVLGNQRNVALAGTVVFAAMSGMAQVIQRYTGTGTLMPEWMRIVSLALVPMATTGSVLILGFIKYFDKDGNWVPDFMERGKNRPAPLGEMTSFRSPQPVSQQLPSPVSRRSAPPQKQNVPFLVVDETKPLPPGAVRWSSKGNPVDAEGKVVGPSQFGNGRKFDNTIEPVTLSERVGKDPTLPPSQHPG